MKDEEPMEGTVLPDIHQSLRGEKPHWKTRPAPELSRLSPALVRPPRRPVRSCNTSDTTAGATPTWNAQWVREKICCWPPRSSFFPGLSSSLPLSSIPPLIAAIASPPPLSSPSILLFLKLYKTDIVKCLMPNMAFVEL